MNMDAGCKNICIDNNDDYAAEEPIDDKEEDEVLTDDDKEDEDEDEEEGEPDFMDNSGKCWEFGSKIGDEKHLKEWCQNKMGGMIVGKEEKLTRQFHCQHKQCQFKAIFLKSCSTIYTRNKHNHALENGRNFQKKEGKANSPAKFEKDYVDCRGKLWNFHINIGKNVSHDIFRTKFGFANIQNRLKTINLYCQKIKPNGEKCQFAGIYLKTNGCLYTRGEHEHMKNGNIPENIGDDYVDHWGKIWKFKKEIGKNVQHEMLRNEFGSCVIRTKESTLNLLCETQKDYKKCKFAGIYLKSNGCLYTRGKHNHEQIQQKNLNPIVGDDYVDIFGQKWPFHLKIGKNVPDGIWFNKFGFTRIRRKKQTLNLNCRKQTPNGKECLFKGIYVEANEFGEIEFNKTLKTDLAEHGAENVHVLLASKELEKSISQMHQLIVELNVQQNDINKMEKIANELKTNANMLKSKWSKFEKSKNLHNTSKKKDRSSVLVIEMKIIRELLSKMQKDIKKWKNTRIRNSKNLHEKSIYGCLQKLTFTINLLKWKTENAKSSKEMKIFMHKELQQLIIKLALLRRFLILQSNRSEAVKLNEVKQIVDDTKPNKLLQKLEQKFKWILRRQNRLADQMQRKERKKFKSKLRNILTKIGEEFKKTRVRTRLRTAEKNNKTGEWFNYSTIEGLLRRKLRQFYYGNEEGKELKIRVHPKGDHTYVTLGNEYEYDYAQQRIPPHRRIFKKWIDVKLEENNKKKAQPIHGLRKFSVAEADAIFFGMPSKGWIPQNYSPERMRRCLVYAYEFVYQLNGRKCPARKQWPEPYRERDYLAAEKPWILNNGLAIRTLSVFSDDYAIYHRKFNRKNEQQQMENGGVGEKCSIRELEIRIRMIKGEQWTNKNKSAEKDADAPGLLIEEIWYLQDKIKQWLPTFVVYDTGRFDEFHFDAYNLSCPFKFTEPLRIEEYLIEEAETQEAILYSALLQVNVCTVNGVARAFVNNLHLWNYNMEVLLYPFGGVNLYEENGEGHRQFTIIYGEGNKQIGTEESSPHPFKLCEYK